MNNGLMNISMLQELAGAGFSALTAPSLLSVTNLTESGGFSNILTKLRLASEQTDVNSESKHSPTMVTVTDILPEQQIVVSVNDQDSRIKPDELVLSSESWNYDKVSEVAALVAEQNIDNPQQAVQMPKPEDAKMQKGFFSEVTPPKNTEPKTESKTEQQNSEQMLPVTPVYFKDFQTLFSVKSGRTPEVTPLPIEKVLLVQNAPITEKSELLLASQLNPEESKPSDKIEEKVSNSKTQSSLLQLSHLKQLAVVKKQTLPSKSDIQEVYPEIATAVATSTLLQPRIKTTEEQASNLKQLPDNQTTTELLAVMPSPTFSLDASVVNQAMTAEIACKPEQSVVSQLQPEQLVAVAQVEHPKAVVTSMFAQKQTAKVEVQSIETKPVELKTAVAKSTETEPTKVEFIDTKSLSAQVTPDVAEFIGTQTAQRFVAAREHIVKPALSLKTGDIPKLETKTPEMLQSEKDKEYQIVDKTPITDLKQMAKIELQAIEEEPAAIKPVEANSTKAEVLILPEKQVVMPTVSLKPVVSLESEIKTAEPIQAQPKAENQRVVKMSEMMLEKQTAKLSLQPAVTSHLEIEPIKTEPVKVALASFFEVNMDEVKPVNVDSNTVETTSDVAAFTTKAAINLALPEEEKLKPSTVPEVQVAAGEQVVKPFVSPKVAISLESEIVTKEPIKSEPEGENQIIYKAPVISGKQTATLAAKPDNFVPAESYVAPMPSKTDVLPKADKIQMPQSAEPFFQPEALLSNEDVSLDATSENSNINESGIKTAQMEVSSLSSTKSVKESPATESALYALKPLDNDAQKLQLEPQKIVVENSQSLATEYSSPSAVLTQQNVRQAAMPVSQEVVEKKPASEVKLSEVKEMTNSSLKTDPTAAKSMDSDELSNKNNEQAYSSQKTIDNYPVNNLQNEQPKVVQHTSGTKPTPSAPLQQVTPEHITNQVRERLTPQELKQGMQQISLTLSPDNLGELKMNLNLQGQKLSVEIFTENRTVRDAIIQHTDSLKESLSRQNITMESFDVSSGGKNSGGQGQNQNAWNELTKQQQQRQFWNSPRGYQSANAQIPFAQKEYTKQQGQTMLDIHY